MRIGHMERHEFLIELTPSFFVTLKREITSAVRGAGSSTVLIEDVPTRLLLRGDQCSLDVTLLSIEHEAIQVRYGQRRETRQYRFRLDVLGDALVLRDLKGDVIEDPANCITGPFVVGLKHPPRLDSSGFSHAMALALARLDGL